MSKTDIINKLLINLDNNLLLLYSHKLDTDEFDYTNDKISKLIHKLMNITNWNIKFIYRLISKYRKNKTKC